MQPHYHIIGGGIAGISAAIGLQKKELPYTLYEKAPEISYDKVGLGISRNIFPILQEWGSLEAVQGIGAEIRTMVFVNKKMKPLRSLQLKQPALSVNRPRFYEILARQLPPENLKLNASPAIGDFPISDIVIAADGAFSGTRRQLFPRLSLRRSGQYLWRGIASIALDKSFHHAYTDFIGGNTRFAIIHTGGNEYSWYAISAFGHSALVEKRNEREMLNHLLREYAPIAREVVNSTEKIYSNELMDMDPAQRKGMKWFRNNLVFIGDSIHPTTPNMANGACLAMEDAYVLSHLLKIWENKVEKAFELYQQSRETKVNTIVNRSWALGQLMHQDNKLMDLMMQAGTRLTPQWAFDKIYEGVLDDESLRMAKGMWKG